MLDHSTLARLDEIPDPRLLKTINSEIEPRPNLQAAASPVNKPSIMCLGYPPPRRRITPIDNTDAAPIQQANTMLKIKSVVFGEAGAE